MALPQTGTGLDLTVTCRKGPYKAVNGAIYFVAKSSGTADTLVVMKSSDPATIAFTQVASWTDANIGFYDTHFNNDRIYFAAGKNVTDWTMTLRAFDCSTDAWAYASQSVSITDSSIIVNKYKVDVVGRSNGELVAFHSGTPEKIGGQDYARVAYTRISSAGAIIESNIRVYTGETVSQGFRHTFIALGEDDRVHFLWSGNDHRSLSSGNVLGTKNTASMVDQTGYGSVGRYVPASGPCEFVVPAEAGTGDVLHFSNAESPTFTYIDSVMGQDAWDDPNTDAPRAWGFYNDTHAHFVYQRATTPAYGYRDQAEIGGTSWGSDIRFLAKNVSLGAANRLSDTVFAVVYRDQDTQTSGDWTYDEFSFTEGDGGTGSGEVELNPISDVDKSTNTLVSNPIGSGAMWEALEFSWNWDDSKVACNPGGDGYFHVGMEGVPADFGKVTYLSVNLATEVEDVIGVDDSFAWYAQVFYNGTTTALTDEVFVGAHGPGSYTTHTNHFKSFSTFYHETNRTYWSSPSVKIRYVYNVGEDGTNVNMEGWTHYLSLDMNYDTPSWSVQRASTIFAGR